MNSRQIYQSNSLDQMLICCPVLVPATYMLLLAQFPSYQALIFLAFVVLLGETHFGLTWLFFLDRRNLAWALRKPLFSVAIPAALTGGFLAVYYLVDSALAILLSAVFSAYHVTMQSAGIARLYGGRTPASALAVKVILGSSAICLFVGFLRFYNPFFDSGASLHAVAPSLGPRTAGLTLMACVIAAVCFIGRLHREQASDNLLLATVTGSLLYSPYLFASRPEHAIAMGVGMHWCQYVAITVPLYRRRSEDAGYADASLLKWKFSQLAVAVLSYAVLMGYLRIDHDMAALGTYDYAISPLIVIPLVLQNLHYYSEMFTWKFSDPHIRDNVGKFVFAPKTEPATQPANA